MIDNVLGECSLKRVYNLISNSNENSDNPKRHFNKGKQAHTTCVQEVELPRKLVPDPQDERCKPKGDQSSPEENDVRGPARTTIVNNPYRSPNTGVANSRGRSQGTDDPAVKVQDKVGSPDSKIARRRMEGQRVRGPTASLGALIRDVKDRRKN
ncbi:hypothetical protein TNIN_229721 [Trichonephila inaurata madagascariensis]|uniref:Uncharacterized protein n=1 Tax=Trichonephila inaurata madagascariensis TaxID=2747483 RepID=A0A8X6XMH9_9ARAC|nr:hypothetical protein TNIN_229721 [Trichonephila inaurata madagascariensis]